MVGNKYRGGMQERHAYWSFHAVLFLILILAILPITVSTAELKAYQAPARPVGAEYLDALSF
jgi:hypothetical protein